MVVRQDENIDLRLQIGLNVAKRRKELKIHQSVLAEKLETDKGVISRIENGHLNFCFSTLANIAYFLDTDLSTLTKV